MPHLPDDVGILKRLAKAITSLSSGVARAATAAAGGLDVPSLSGLLEDVSLLVPEGRQGIRGQG